jgi:hypothetical protein
MEGVCVPMYKKAISLAVLNTRDISADNFTHFYFVLEILTAG